MHAWEAIQKTLDYIEENISEDIETEILAKEAALSPFYYQRLFSKLVKKPVKEYIKLRRLSKAGALLTGSDKRILDIALLSGFGSHEAFTRVFKEAYGITPKQYRDNPVMLNQFDKPDLLLNYVMIDEGVPLISDGLVLEMNRHIQHEPIPFVGVKGYVPIASQMPLGEATGVDLPGEIWQRFHKEKENMPRVASGRELGVAYMGDATEGSFTYFTGAETEPGTAGGQYDIWELPAGEYVVCGFEAESFEELVTVAINKAVKYSSMWLNKHGLTIKMYSPEIYYTANRTYMELWSPVNSSADL